VMTLAKNVAMATLYRMGRSNRQTTFARCATAERNEHE
jgi:hypothetical protein